NTCRIVPAVKKGYETRQTIKYRTIQHYKASDSNMGNFWRYISLGLVFVLNASISDAGHRMTVVNRCPQIVWVGTFGDNEIPAGGGFRLNPGQSNTFDVRYKWLSGRIWGRTGCDSSGRNCDTGDCGATNCRGRTTFDAVTLAEFGLDTNFMDLDFWDISQVDGFNLPMSIRPISGTVKEGNKCRPKQAIQCKFNMAACPQKFRQFSNKNGKLVACKSACTESRQDRFCCPEHKGFNRHNCPQPTDESRIFKNQCPDAYSHAYDDETSLFACQSATPGSSSYEVVFCP
ncbi:unnamed protein product, partial [Allacma fusca]